MALPITLLTDYGYTDEFAGVCRAVIARIAPAAPVVDITHGIERQDVRSGAAALGATLPYAAPGVHLAVVDPGVGSRRRAVALATREEQRLLVGPDNGLLMPAAEKFGGVAEAVDVGRSPVRLEPTSATFHGRDVFAPVAAHLALGTPLAEVGEPVDPGSLISLDPPAARIEAGRRASCEVARVDGYGNVALALTAAQAREAGLERGMTVSVEAGDVGTEAMFALAFADVPEGTMLVYVDANETIALAVNLGDASERLRVAAGDRVVLRAG